MTSNPSAEPTPRPPETTIAASASSGRSPVSWTTLSVTLAPLAASLTVTSTVCSSAAAGAGSAATEFGRTVTMGVPVLTAEWTTVAPPNTDCSATILPSCSARPTASQSMPEFVLTASRPATSLFCPVEAISTAAGETWATRAARTSASGPVT